MLAGDGSADWTGVWIGETSTGSSIVDGIENGMKRTLPICVLFSMAIGFTSTAGSSTAPPYDLPRTRSFSPPAIEPVGSSVGDAGVDFGKPAAAWRYTSGPNLVLSCQYPIICEGGGRPLSGDRARVRGAGAGAGARAARAGGDARGG